MTAFRPFRRARSAPAFSIPSWATPWRRGQPSRTGPRIAVVGNAQAGIVAEVLALLLPDARVELRAPIFLQREFKTITRFSKHLEPFDHVFTHVFNEEFLLGCDVHALGQALPKMRLFPTMAFPAFHPDMVLVGALDAMRLSRLLESPIGRSHSAIALCAYREGLSVAETLKLYEDSVFERLGYYALWQEGAAFLQRSGQATGFDLSADLIRWSRRGCFMHDVNHPKLHVLADIARRLAVEAGLNPLDIAVEDYLPDRLIEEASWPIYSAVAQHYGVPAASLFHKPGKSAAEQRVLDLPTFVAESFAIYDRHAPEALGCQSVDGWRADPAIRELFASARSP